jgi:hypothetical protein
VRKRRWKEGKENRKDAKILQHNPDVIGKRKRKRKAKE